MNEWLHKSAEKHQVSPRWARFLFLLPVVGAVVVAVSRLDKGLYKFLLEEDGPVEWVQFACFLLAAVYAAGATAELLKRKRASQSLFLGLFALGMLFIAGEEISWGQRLLEVRTPASLEAINKQDETNLHNIVGVLDLFNFVMMIGAAWGATAWYWNRRRRLEPFWYGAERLLVPPMFLAPSFALLAAYRFLRFTVLPDDSYTIMLFGEWAELCLAFPLCVYARLNYRWAKSVCCNATQPQPVAAEAEHRRGASLRESMF